MAAPRSCFPWSRQNICSREQSAGAGAFLSPSLSHLAGEASELHDHLVVAVVQVGRALHDADLDGAVLGHAQGAVGSLAKKIGNWKGGRGGSESACVCFRGERRYDGMGIFRTHAAFDVVEMLRGMARAWAHLHGHTSNDVGSLQGLAADELRGRGRGGAEGGA
jgi:hypothetical protein